MTISKQRSHKGKPVPPGTVVAADMQPINPNFFYRQNEGPKYFGLEATALDDAIKAGLIPTPIPVTDQGRDKGWFGWMILEWQEARAAGREWKAAAKSRKAGAS